eukprot:2819020-Prymnesium_polylepis.1
MTSCIVRGNHAYWVSAPRMQPRTHPKLQASGRAVAAHTPLCAKKQERRRGNRLPPPRTLGMSTQKGGGLAVYDSADARLVDVTFDANTASDD